MCPAGSTDKASHSNVQTCELVLSGGKGLNLRIRFMINSQ